ncbi:long-chain fatty acid--CoA ligase [bacterium]|nr:long-chain fatty acid--CoA ligase [bacterium]
MEYSNQYKNLSDLFYKKITQKSTQTALISKENGVWVNTTWERYGERAKNIGMALKKLGLNSLEKVSILSNSMIEWVIADMGILGINGVTIPIYQSNTPKEVEYIINHSDSKIVFVEDKKQLEKVIQVYDNLATKPKVILIKGESDKKFDWLLTWKEVESIGEKYSFDEFKKLSENTPDSQLATIVYTSGTTGVPKGVMLSHRALLANAEGLADSLKDIAFENEIILMFLPLAHIFAKVMHILSIYAGFQSAYAESIEKLMDNIGEIKPHFMGSVPRIYEKVYSKIVSDVENGSFVKKKVFNWAIEVGESVSKAIQQKKSISPVLKVQYELASKLVFSKLKNRFGGRLKFFASAGAPLAKEIAQFFHASGILILEAYGLTELAGASTINKPDLFKFGTVGPATKTVDIKLADDGEIICKGAMVMDGYYKDINATTEALVDGWFYSGDIGVIDNDGYITITDRKKDIIVTAGGKNIAPQGIENLMKTDHRISQIIVLGDKMRYLVALVNINFEEAEKFAATNGIIYKSKDELTGHPKIIQWMEEIISEKNSTLPSFSTIKKFKIVPNEFSIENGELTPTLKVKRKICMERYKKDIDEMYI